MEEGEGGEGEAEGGESRGGEGQQKPEEEGGGM